jgi:hypothetical protein
LHALKLICRHSRAVDGTSEHGKCSSGLLCVAPIFIEHDDGRSPVGNFRLDGRNEFVVELSLLVLSSMNSDRSASRQAHDRQCKEQANHQACRSPPGGTAAHGMATRVNLDSILAGAHPTCIDHIDLLIEIGPIYSIHRLLRSLRVRIDNCEHRGHGQDSFR